MYSFVFSGLCFVEYFYVYEKMKKTQTLSISLHLTLLILMDFPINVERISMELPILYLRGHI